MVNFPSIKEQLKECKPITKEQHDKLSNKFFDIYSYSGKHEINIGDKILYALFRDGQKLVLNSLSEQEAIERKFYTKE